MAEGESVGTCLLDEIERVSAKRERWREYAKDAGPQANLQFAIAMMTVAIDAAKTALANSDTVACIAALESLRGFDSDD
ncbi:MAG: hypothetical protein WDN46_08185 [Methylocella sp.]